MPKAEGAALSISIADRRHPAPQGFLGGSSGAPPPGVNAEGRGRSPFYFNRRQALTGGFSGVSPGVNAEGRGRSPFYFNRRQAPSSPERSEKILK